MPNGEIEVHTRDLNDGMMVSLDRNSGSVYLRKIPIKDFDKEISGKDDQISPVDAPQGPTSTQLSLFMTFLGVSLISLTILYCLAQNGGGLGQFAFMLNDLISNLRSAPAGVSTAGFIFMMFIRPQWLVRLNIGSIIKPSTAPELIIGINAEDESNGDNVENIVQEVFGSVAVQKSLGRKLRVVRLTGVDEDARFEALSREVRGNPNAISVLIDITADEFDSGKVMEYVEAIELEAISELEQVKDKRSIRGPTGDLIKAYRTILTMNDISPALRTKIAGLIIEILGNTRPFNFEEALKNRLAQGPLSADAVAGLRTLIVERRAEIAKAYNTVQLPAKVPGKNATVAVTEECALNNPNFAEEANTARKERDTTTVLIYGNKLKTIEKARQFAHEAGCNPDDIKYINMNEKNDRGEEMDYAELISNITAISGLDVGHADRIGIMTAEGEKISPPGYMLGKERFFVVRYVSVNGGRVLGTIGAYNTLLGMVTNGQIPPTVTQNKNGWFTYIPRAVPIDYGREITEYSTAMRLLSSAA